MLSPGAVRATRVSATWAKVPEWGHVALDFAPRLQALALGLRLR
jgi:hypothetical protein